MPNLINMYTLNEVNGVEPEYGRLTVTQNPTATPKTPEILQDLLVFEDTFLKHNQAATSADKKICSPSSEYTSADTCSSSSSHVDSPTSPLAVHNNIFIKESLKLTLQRKISKNVLSSETEMTNKTTNGYCSSKHEESGIDTEEDDTSSSFGDASGSLKGLTPEDEDRRKRRRERNKIAATKCRLKKRAHTNSLVMESEALANKNKRLKLDIEAVEQEREKLRGMLTIHKTICLNPSPEQSPIVVYQQPPPLDALSNNSLFDISSLGNAASSESYEPGRAAGPSLLLEATHHNFYDFVRDASSPADSRQNTTVSTNFTYETMTNFRNVDQSMSNHYDVMYVNSSISGRCMG